MGQPLKLRKDSHHDLHLYASGHDEDKINQPRDKPRHSQQTRQSHSDFRGGKNHQQSKHESEKISDITKRVKRDIASYDGKLYPHIS